jgi:hypothetical protein
MVFACGQNPANIAQDESAFHPDSIGIGSMAEIISIVANGIFTAASR